MNFKDLAIVLRVVAVLILVLVAGELLVLDVLMVPPIVIAIILMVLSFLFARLPRVVAGVALVLSILVPLGAINGYLTGQLVLLVPIFDVVVFAWTFWTALGVFRQRAAT